MQNDMIALSVNSCGKSFHIGNEVVFSLAVLVKKSHGILALHPTW